MSDPQVRDFAKATGELAKTDRLDAQVLALFAERVRPEPRALPDVSQRALEALLSRRRQLIGMLVAERNRLLLADAAIQKSLTKHVRRQRSVWGGRATGRAALYMAALASITHDPVIGGFYRRLVASGKPKVRTVRGPVALVACMRKLLVTCNAVVRDGQPWETNLAVVA